MKIIIPEVWRKVNKERSSDVSVCKQTRIKSVVYNASTIP
jgi:hypothetical protein